MKDIKVGDKVKILWTNAKLREQQIYFLSRADKGDICEVSCVDEDTPHIRVNGEGNFCWIPLEAVELIPSLKCTKEHFHNTKVRVTPDQSEKFQKVLAEYGIGFLGETGKQGNYNRPYLYVSGSNLFYGSNKDSFENHRCKEINVLDYIDNSPNYLWILDLVGAGMEGKKVLCGGEDSEVVPEIIEIIKTKFANTRKEDYTVVDSSEIRSKIDALRQQIKDLEAQL